MLQTEAELLVAGRRRRLLNVRCGSCGYYRTVLEGQVARVTYGEPEPALLPGDALCQFQAVALRGVPQVHDCGIRGQRGGIDQQRLLGFTVLRDDGLGHLRSPGDEPASAFVGQIRGVGGDEDAPFVHHESSGGSRAPVGQGPVVRLVGVEGQDGIACDVPVPGAVPDLQHRAADQMYGVRRRRRCGRDVVHYVAPRPSQGAHGSLHPQVRAGDDPQVDDMIQTVFRGDFGCRTVGPPREMHMGGDQLDLIRVLDGFHGIRRQPLDGDVRGPPDLAGVAASEDASPDGSP